MCNRAHLHTHVPQLTQSSLDILLHFLRYSKVCGGRLKWGNVYCIFSEVIKAAFFSYEMDFHSCTIPTRALSYC